MWSDMYRSSFDCVVPLKAVHRERGFLNICMISWHCMKICCSKFTLELQTTWSHFHFKFLKQHFKVSKNYRKKLICR
jgi:hypothetical protein